MIHKYKLAGYNIVLDVNSGGVHVVDDLTYDILDNIEPPFSEKCPENVIQKLLKFHNEEDIRTCYAEVVELYNRKILFSDDVYSPGMITYIDAPLKAMCLNVSRGSNLKCEYSSSSDSGEKSLMTADTARRALDFLVKNSKDRQLLEVEFSGGEPLLNPEVIKETVSYAHTLEMKTGKKFRFSITTNGLLLDDEITDYINAEMSDVILYADGRKEVNDRVRKLSDGSGSYDSVMPRFKTLVEKRNGLDYCIKGKFTRYNPDFSDDVYSLYEAGFSQISLEPVSADPSEPYAVTEMDLPAVFREYDRLAARMIESAGKGEKFNFFHFMIDLDQGPCAVRRVKGCGCGNEYAAVTPDGDIYPCLQFAGERAYIMGNVEDGTFDESIRKKFASAHIYSKPECRKCWAKFYCSGGCNANNYKFNGDINSAYKLSCLIQKKRLECAIVLQAAEAEAAGEI